MPKINNNNNPSVLRIQSWKPSLSSLLWMLALLLIAAGASRQAEADNVDGSWSPLSGWPLIGIHSALTPDGRVLTYGTDGTGKQTGFFIYDIWDPSAGLGGGHMTLDNMTLTDIFCSSQIILPQSAEILIAGGDNWTGTGTTNTGNNNSNLFNPNDNTLARSANMNRARWYSSSTVLVNGDIYIQGGNGGADFPEVRETNGTFRLLTGAGTGGLATVFPRNFLAQDGRVFGYDTAGRMYFITTDGTGTRTNLGQFSSSYAGWTSSNAMYRPGRILQFGGNSNGAIIIDINGPQPTVTPTQSMSSQRQWVNATIMADGRVVATGGSRVANQLTDVNNIAEIWDPATGQWHQGAEGARARLYHSTAILLPDATVLVAGGGAPGPFVNTNAEIYSPPYLFDSVGAFAPRPTIINAPDTVNVGDTLTVEVDSTVSRVTFVKTSSVTHSFNMDQRFLELPFDSSGNTVFVDLPVRATDVPPGFYQLFVFNNDGVPSHARMVRVNIDPTPNSEVNYTPTIGGGGGSPFQIACAADETVVGVHGNFSTYVNQIGPQCVKVDQLGRWIGDPVDGSVAGTTTSGTPFSKTCPRDFAISGFRGNAASYVDQIEIQCRQLTSSGGLTGTEQYLGADGGPGGLPQGPFSCDTNNPASALYGRSGGWIDAFGVLCQAAPITPISINSSPAIVDPGDQSGVVGASVDLQISASDGDGDPLTYSAVGLPPGLSIAAATGRITGTPTTAGSYDVDVTVNDGSDSDMASFVWDIAIAPALSVDPMSPLPPVLVDTAVTYTATASGGLNVQYAWDFGDGNTTGPSSSPSATHTFTDPAIRFITLTVTDDLGGLSIQSFGQAIHLPLTANAPRHSTNIIYETPAVGNPRTWVINQDNDSVSAFDTTNNTRIAEIAVGAAPRSLAVAPDGRIWVTNKSDSNISIIDPNGLSVVDTISLPFASQPFGIVFSPAAANEAYVVLEGSGFLQKLNASDGAALGAVDVGPNVRHLSISGDGATIYVSRFISPPQPGEHTATIQTEVLGVKMGGEIVVVDANSLTALPDPIRLQHSDKLDAEDQGRGLPNYLGAAAISPDGSAALVPSKMDNIERGGLRDGSDLNFQNTVRAISSHIDLATGAEDYANRIDLDDSSVASAIVFDHFGIYAFVALETSREVAVIDVHGRFEVFRIDVGRAPQGIAISDDDTTLYVNNFMDRTVGVFDLADLMVNGQWNVPSLAEMPSIVTEKLAADVLLGKQLFYDARDIRLARDRYLSCGSCHNDGGYDGRTWDLTNFGEGLRNTINLSGTAASHGPLHWSANFDEVQDFERQIRELSGGDGLMSDADFLAGTRSEPLGDPKAGISADLDALAAYVASLDQFARSPFRNPDGSLTADAIAGRAIFEAENCAGCHSGTAFTDSAPDNLHDIGTISQPTSGNRLNGTLDGLDTPTVVGIWNTAPYLHDGSAATIQDAIAAHNGFSLSQSDLDQLAAYLSQLDGDTAVTPSCGGCIDFNADPTVTFTGDVSGNVTVLNGGLSIRLEDNTWRMTTGTYDITPDTVLEFDFESTSEGEIHGIGFDTDASPTSGRVFMLYGTQNTAWAIQDFNTYTGPGSEHFKIPVGQYYTGTGMHLVLVNDQDNGSGSNSTFSNIQVYEDIAPPVPLPPTIDDPGDQTSWLGTSLSLTITASDPNGDTLAFSATGLPPGLSIDSSSGEINGAATALGISTVTVTVDDGNGGSAVATFDWTVVEVPACPDCVDFSADPTTTFPDDVSGNVTVLNGGLSIRLADNTWRMTIGTFDISADTVLEFDFESTSEGEIHGLGFDADGSPSSGTVFQVYGTQTTSWAIQDFNTYTGPGPEHFRIPVGQYYTGTGKHLVLVNDQDNGSGSNGTFSNVRVYEDTAPPVPQPPMIDDPGNQTSWLDTPTSVTITASDPNGDTLTFTAAGLPPGLTIDSSSGEISGAATALGTWAVMVTVDDGNGGTDVTTFDWTVIEVPACPGCLDFNADPTTTYTGDVSGNVTVLNGGLSIRLADNTWRQTIGTFDITPNTVLEFDFESTSEGEIHGIGFEIDNNPSRRRVFMLYGTQVGGWSINDFNTYGGAGSEHFTIPVGQYYTGTGMHLLLVNDQDNGSGSNGTFSNVRIYEP